MLHYFSRVVILYAVATNGAMYAKAQPYRSAQSVVSCLYQQFIHYLHPCWGNPNCKPITEQFYKNIPARRKHNGDNGDRKDNVLNMINNQYLDHMYKAWLKDRKSVSSSWDSYFKLIHTENPKDSRARLSSIRVSSSSKLVTPNLDGGQSGKREF